MPGRRDLFGRHGVGDARFGPPDRRDLLVRRVAAVLAEDQRVLAGRVQEHELVRLAAAHHPDVGGDGDRLEAQPLEVRS